MYRSLLALSVLGALILAWVTLPIDLRVLTAGVPEFGFGVSRDRFEEGKVLFTGDIMLGRAIERILREKGADYPFSTLTEIIRVHHAVLGNFEGAVPETHTPTPDFGFRFSVREEYLSLLRDAGFTSVSLANNHAYDFGEAGYAHTRAACARHALSCIGAPHATDTYETTVMSAGSTRVGILPLMAVGGLPTTTPLLTAIESLSRESDVQVAYVHWGTEYTHTPREEERALAHFLVDAGVDAVVGHHPHVVQSVETYRGAPIIYSLGNLIFDQYFSRAVEEGALLSMSFGEAYISYTLIPYETYTNRAQPHLLQGEARARVLATMLGDLSLPPEALALGSFSLPRERTASRGELAVFTERAMIDPHHK